MKKYISILMAACLLFGSVCISAYADGFIFDSVNIPAFEKLSRDEQEKVYPGL